MKRPRIVLDTNVLISAMLFGGVPREILNLVLSGKITCSLSQPIIDELLNVLQRPKFGLSLQQAVAIAEELSDLCTIVSPEERVQVIADDPDDNRIVECAMKAKAAFIVSGDAHLLALGAYKDIRILSPSEFLQLIASTTGEGRKRRR